MEQALTFKDPEGHAVSAVLTRPRTHTDNIAVLCHGFLSGKNSTTNKVLTPLLVDQGIGTFRLDFFGHGESPGPFEALTVSRAVRQALAALDLVASMGYARIGLVGSSFGGLVAILAAATWARPPSAGEPDKAQPRTGLACLALKCPVVDFPEELHLQLGKQGMAEWKRTDTIPDPRGGPSRLRLAYAFYEDATRNVAYEAACAVTAPTLIVHGEEDALVPVHQSTRFFDALTTEKSLRLLPGADHQFTRGEDFREMTTLLAGWLTTYLSSDRGQAESRPYARHPDLA